MFILNVILTYLIGIAVAAVLIYSRIKQLNEAKIRSKRRSAEREAEMLEIGYEIKRQLLKEAAMAEPLPEHKNIRITPKGVAAAEIAAAWAKQGGIIDGRTHIISEP